MKEKLSKIYLFLIANRQFNKSVQASFYNFCISPNKKPADKACSLLFHILNTQSQPNIDKVAIFWQSILRRNGKLSSFKAFLNALSTKQNYESPFSELFKALTKQPGWGNKTAALFVKAIYHVHKGQYKKYSFWNDVPSLGKKDQLRLPVDTVISYIFKKLSQGKIKSFAAINNVLTKNEYKGKKMEVWDDLWFWGFITQKGMGNERSIGFNEAKYWAMPYSDKNSSTIKKIRNRAIQFKKLIA